MTEAFCGMNPTSWHIYYGETNFTHSSDSEAIISTNFVSHPLFNYPVAWFENNIGLIELPTNIEFSSDVRAITLPWESKNEQDINAFFVGARINGMYLLLVQKTLVFNIKYLVVFK